MKGLLRYLSSLAFALALLAALVLVLTASTLFESAFGTPLAQSVFYRAAWFPFFLSLVAVNIVGSALSRRPYKKHHTGFLVTHLGILILLFGSLLSCTLGAEGQIALGENQAKDAITLPEHSLETRSARENRLYPLKVFQGRPRKAASLAGYEVRVNEVSESVVETSAIAEGGPQDPPNPAIRFTLRSSMAGLDKSFWLIERHPHDPASRQIAMGPAVFTLRDRPKDAPRAASDRSLIVGRRNSEESWKIRLDPIPSGDVPLGNSGLTVSGLRYLPDARVTEAMELVSASEEPNNPAVEFTVRDGKGNREVHTKFLLFPEFESLHGRTKTDHFGLTVSLVVPEAKPKPSKPRRALDFIPGSPWRYESHGTSGETGGAIEAGKTYQGGWMDFEFTVDRLYERAVIRRSVKKIEEKRPGAIAADVSVLKDGIQVTRQWVFPGTPLEIPGGLTVAVTETTMPVPFSLKLVDFRKVDYPGTQNAASFESDVVLTDTADKTEVRRTISMNKPLDHKGWRIFQASYSQDPEAGETSVFSVAKNPGIIFIYSGAVVLFTGVVLVFYVKPFSSLHHWRKSRAQKKKR